MIFISACEILGEPVVSDHFIKYRIVQNFDEGKLCRMEHSQNFDKLIVGFKGETLRDKENFDKSLTTHRIHQCFLHQNFALYGSYGMNAIIK